MIERGTRLMNRAAPLHLSQALLDLHLAQGVRVEQVGGKKWAGYLMGLTRYDGRALPADLMATFGVTREDILARFGADQSVRPMDWQFQAPGGETLDRKSVV